MSFVIIAKTSETKNANSSSRPKWLVIYFRPRRTSYASIATSMFSRPDDDQKGVAVLVGRRRHHALAEVHAARDEIRDADAEIGDRGQATSGSEKIKREQPAVERQTDREHQRQRDQEDDALLPPPCMR